MINEVDILLNIQKTLHDLSTNINTAKIQFDISEKDISNLDNNYFIEDKTVIEVKVIVENRIALLVKQLYYYETIINNKLNNICEHEWITDDIDIDPERSTKITYCKCCEVSKKCCS